MREPSAMRTFEVYGDDLKYSEAQATSLEVDEINTERIREESTH